MRHDRVDRIEYVAEIGLAKLVERRRHTDDQCVRTSAASEICRRFEATLARRGHRSGRNVLDVATPGVERLYLRLVDVKTHNLVANFRISQGKWQSDVAKAINA